MFVQFTCKECDEKKKNEIYQVLSALCAREEIQIDDCVDYVKITCCPQGIIKVFEEDDKIILNANTRHGGPGFHAFVVDFCRDIEEEIEGKYEMEDDLGFDEQGDFNALQSLYEDEVRYLKSVLLENKRFRSQNYLYEETFFLPIEKENYIHTVLGGLDEKEFQSKEPGELMNHFYLWNHWDKDAQFYKNCALYLLASEGVGLYTMMNEHTEKQANLICDYIELAYQKDPSIALPVDEYDELIQQLGRDNRLQNPKVMRKPVTQYKQKDVYHLYKDCKIVCDGACERSADFVNDSLCLMSPFVDETWDYMLQAGPNEKIIQHKELLEKEKDKQIDKKNVKICEIKEDGLYCVEGKVSKREKSLYIRALCSDIKWVPYLKKCIQESNFMEE